MPTVNATVGASDANSYITVAEGTTYLDARLNSSAWTDASADDKARAVIEATRTLDTLRFIGSCVTSAQALQWPREYALDPDAPDFLEYGEAQDLYYAETIIPQRVKDATCELALEFLKAGTTDLAVADPDRGLVSKTVDVLSKTWAAGQKPSDLARFSRVMGLLAPLLAAAAGTRMVRK